MGCAFKHIITVTITDSSAKNIHSVHILLPCMDIAIEALEQRKVASVVGPRRSLLCPFVHCRLLSTTYTAEGPFILESDRKN